MCKKKYVIGIWLICSILFCMISISIPYHLFELYGQGIVLTNSEFQSYLGRQGLLFSKIQGVHAVDDEKNNQINQYTIGYKLFNLFNILTLKVDVVSDKQVYAGGNAVGIVLDTKGVILVGSNAIVTKDGLIDTLKGSQLQVGDVITKINSIEINTMEDITTALQTKLEDEEVKIEYKRDGEIKHTKMRPALDALTGEYKLGLWVKDNAVGVGTLTYVKQDMHYGSLGHAITDGESLKPIEVSGGQLYKANIVGIKKGVVGVPGELMGLFVQGRNQIGNIDKNTIYGVYGAIFEDSGFLDNKALIPLGSRSQAKPGKAQILSTLDGEKIETFEVEIIKTNYQSSATEKSMVVKVTDPNLIARTGGIVQGMSGSPIIQDGKLVGAITHVFVSDPTKGFGLYIDWMLKE